MLSCCCAQTLRVASGYLVVYFLVFPSLSFISASTPGGVFWTIFVRVDLLVAHPLIPQWADACVVLLRVRFFVFVRARVAGPWRLRRATFSLATARDTATAVSSS